MNEKHKNIEKVELENIIKKLNVKKACGEGKITNKIIKLTFNGTKEFFLKLFNFLYTMGTIQKCSKNHK